VPPVPVPVPPSKDSAVAKRYKILDRPLNRDEVSYFLAAFQLHWESKPDSSPMSTVWRDKQGAIMSYEPGISEMAFTSENTAMLGQKDIVPDSLIRSETDEILTSILKAKADRYVFANYEITMVQKKNATSKEANGKDVTGRDGVQPPVPAFYIGRYIRKVDERIVLGDAFQIRIGYGAEGAIQTFSFRDPVLADGGSINVPTRQMVLDSLKRWERSKTHTRAYTYPYHSDHLHIRSLKPVKVFESYVMAQEKNRDAAQMGGSYLLPSVTVLAQVIVSPSKERNSESVPTEPVLLHFHFPCRPASGLCWPDGPKDLEDVTASQARTPSTSSSGTPAPVGTVPPVKGNGTPSPLKPEIPAHK
jgi:hypothetical protein